MARLITLHQIAAGVHEQRLALFELLIEGNSFFTNDLLEALGQRPNACEAFPAVPLCCGHPMPFGLITFKPRTHLYLDVSARDLKIEYTYCLGFFKAESSQREEPSCCMVLLQSLIK